MRTAFSIAIMVLAVFYAALAFGDLNFLTPRGRIGPGFFPQIVGALLVAFTLSAAIADFRRRHLEEAISSDWTVAIGVVGMVGIFIAASHYLGALPGMVIFMLLSLTVLNRGQHVVNALVGVLLPTALFAAFRFWLNAAMPPGMLGLSY